MHADLIADLHLNHLQFRIGNNRVFASCLHRQYIAHLHGLFHVIDHRTAFSGYHRPYFVPEIMTMVIHPMSGIQRYFDSHTVVTHIQYLEAPLDLFPKHYLLSELIHIRGDIAGLLLVRHDRYPLTL